MEKIKALALFSGGLDSALAIKVVQEQGIEVILYHIFLVEKMKRLKAWQNN